MTSRYLARESGFHSYDNGIEQEIPSTIKGTTKSHSNNSNNNNSSSTTLRHHENGRGRNATNAFRQQTRSGKSSTFVAKTLDFHESFDQNNTAMGQVNDSNSSGFISSFDSSANSQDSIESTSGTPMNHQQQNHPNRPFTSSMRNHQFKKKDDFNASSSSHHRVINPKGNIFFERDDYSFIDKLPKEKRNAYFIQLEDDSCTGNEDMRTFLLTQLTNNGINTIHCISCSNLLRIYDHFPIIDGVLFFSPVSHSKSLNEKKILICWNASSNAVNQYNSQSVIKKSNENLFKEPLIPPPGCSGPRQIQSNGETTHGHKRNGLIHQEKYLNALCGQCLHNDRGKSISCVNCNSSFQAKNIIFGSLYTFDILASEPCCKMRLMCKGCQAFPLTLDQIYKLNSFKNDTSQEMDSANSNEIKEDCLLRPFPYFSQYSSKFICSHCNKNDYHFVKPFHEIYQ